MNTALRIATALCLALGGALVLPQARAELATSGYGSPGEREGVEASMPGEKRAASEAPSSKSEAELLLRRADDSYLDGRYEEARKLYGSATKGGFGTADVWFNLGNSAWEAGKPGEAVLAWERALLREPGHRDARANLSFAGARLVDDVSGSRPDPAIERLARRLPVSLVTWAFFAAWLFTVACLLSRRFARRRALPSVLAALGVVAVLSFGSLFGLAVWFHEGVVRAVVVAPVAQVRAGPAPRFDAVFEVHEGLVVRVLGYDGPYSRVRLGNERGGWILRRSLEEI